MTLFPLGDAAVVLVVGDAVDAQTASRVRGIAQAIEAHPPAGAVDIVPSFASVAVFFDPARAPAFETLRSQLETIVDTAAQGAPPTGPRTVEIPVCYDGECGPDIAAVAEHTKLPPRDIIALHSGADYVVHAIGFAPGFPYLGGMPASLSTPRRATPRPVVPAGSVGIGGAQTGVYPFAMPGGWNLIGRTPLRLFDQTRPAAALLQAGDQVRFRAIAREEFDALARNECAAPAREPDSVMACSANSGVEVVRAGMFTTVQDAGRVGARASGVPLSGAADPFALRLANALVGNPEQAAALEFTLIGPELKFTHETVVALTGADFPGLPRWGPIVVAAGTVLKLGTARSGSRGYLALAGGIEVPPVLGSRSTYVRAALGGFGGRALRDGDLLPVPHVPRIVRDHWRIDERILPAYSADAVVRVVAGRHIDQFGAAWTRGRYRISSRSDRMGVRSMGEALPRSTARELISLPVAPGTIQVPPDGQPIVLLADAQTIGGYPQLAHVISVDLPLVAQLRPGDAVRFTLVSLDIARELLVAQEKSLALLREGLAQKLA